MVKESWMERDIQVTRKFWIGLALIIPAGAAIWSSFYIIGAGEQGVEFSAVSGVKDETTPPGVHFKIPFVESVTKYEVRSRLYSADAAGASRDLQDVHTQIGVQYHPDAAYVSWLHQNIGPAYAARVIVPAVQEAVKAATAQHEAVNLIVNRQVVKDEITRLLSDRLAASHIIVEQTSITDFDFSPQFNAAIEAKVTAEQNALAARNKLEQVKFEADQARALAQGQADAAKILGERLNALGPDYLEWVWLDKWDGKTPLYVGNGGSSAAFILPGLIKE